MNNFDIKTPENFDSYNIWKDLQTGVMEYRNEIKQCKSRLSELTAKLPELRKANRQAVDKRDANIDEIESAEKALKNTEAQIKKVKQQWAEAEQNLKHHEIKIEEAKLVFLKKTAPYVEQLLSEFLPVIDRAAAIKNAIQTWGQFDDLRIPNIDSEAIHYWAKPKRRDNLLAGFENRYEELQNGFETRELQKLKRQLTTIGE